MLNSKKAIEVLEQHFQEVTKDKFVDNLHQYCPEVVEHEDRGSQSHQRQNKKQKSIDLKEKVADVSN